MRHKKLRTSSFTVRVITFRFCLGLGLALEFCAASLAVSRQELGPSLSIAFLNGVYLSPADNFVVYLPCAHGIADSVYLL